MNYRAWVFGIAVLFSIASARAQSVDVDIPRKQLELGVFALKKGAEQSVNVTVSPLSIHSALMLLRLGARGAVAQEIDEKLLSAPFSSEVQGLYTNLISQMNLSSEMVTSTLANAVWLQSGLPFQKGYVADSQRIFASEPQHVDFGEPESARGAINRWVSSKTHGLVSHLLPAGSLSRSSTCVLVNALYFKSAWLHAFDSKATREGDFWNTPSSSSKVPMMSSSKSLGYFEDGAWQGVQLRYQGLDFMFVVLVPKEKRSVGGVVRDLTPELFTRAIVDARVREVELTLPRFKARFSMDLMEQLKVYGLNHLERGDYSGISPRNVSRVSGVLHEAVVSVDEIGTEAAAATAITMVGGAMVEPDHEGPTKVTVDRPFAFALVQRSSTAPLFVGVVGDPR
jgi:serpin B